MEIFEIATELGKALKNDARLVRMENARKAYEADEKLNTLLAEYNAQSKALRNVSEQEELDPEFIKLIRNRIDALCAEIESNPVYVELNASQEDVNELMQRVNDTIMFNITGELPSSCTHDCSSCGGCH